MMTKILVFISRLSKRERYIFYGAALVISLTFLDRLILGAISSKIELLDKEIQIQEAVIRKSLYILTQKDRIGKALGEYAFSAASSQSQEEEMVFFLRDIEELANKCSLYVIDIKQTGIIEEDILKEYLVRVNCEGQMEQLAEFFYRLENSNQLMKIEKYDIRPKTKGSSVARCTVFISKAVLP